MHLKELENKRCYTLLWWFAILAGFAVIHATNERIFFIIEHYSVIPHNLAAFMLSRKQAVVQHIFTPVKAVVFLLSMIILIPPLLPDFQKSIKANRGISQWFFEKQTLLVFILLALLVIPASVRSMGTDYADMSIAPFEAGDGWFYKRLLMPALANMLFLQGRGFYLLFSLFFTLVLIQLTRIWLTANKVSLTFIQFLSLGTSSFIIFQFQVPGYPDALMHILLLLAFTFPLKNSSKVTVLALAILAHESSMFLSVILAIFILGRRSLMKFYVLCAVYCIFWVGSYGFAPDAAVGSHQVDGLSALQWMQHNPMREVIGILGSYKALWFFVIIGLVLLWQKKEYKPLLLSVLLLLSSFGMTFLAVDTSRIMGWSFIALLLTVKAVHQANEKVWIKKSLNIVYVANLLIPSVYIAVNIHPIWFTGLYRGYRVLFDLIL